MNNLFTFKADNKREEQIVKFLSKNYEYPVITNRSSGDFLTLNEKFYSNFIEDLRLFNSVNILENGNFYISARDFKNMCQSCLSFSKNPTVHGKYNFYRNTFPCPKVILYDYNVHLTIKPEDYQSVCFISRVEAEELFYKLTTPYSYQTLKNLWKDFFPNNFEYLVNLTTIIGFCEEIFDSVSEEELVLIKREEFLNV